MPRASSPRRLAVASPSGAHTTAPLFQADAPGNSPGESPRSMARAHWTGAAWAGTRRPGDRPTVARTGCGVEGSASDARPTTTASGELPGCGPAPSRWRRRWWPGRARPLRRRCRRRRRSPGCRLGELSPGPQARPAGSEGARPPRRKARRPGLIFDDRDALLDSRMAQGAGRGREASSLMSGPW